LKKGNASINCCGFSKRKKEMQQKLWEMQQEKIGNAAEQMGGMQQ